MIIAIKHDLKIILIDAFKACYFFFSLKYVVGLRNIYFVSGKLSFNIDRPIICKKIRYNWPIGQHRVACTQFWNVYSSATSCFENMKPVMIPNVMLLDVSMYFS